MPFQRSPGIAGAASLGVGSDSQTLLPLRVRLRPHGLGVGECLLQAFYRLFQECDMDIGAPLELLEVAAVHGDGRKLRAIKLVVGGFVSGGRNIALVHDFLLFGSKTRQRTFGPSSHEEE